MNLDPNIFFGLLGLIALAYGLWQLCHELAPRFWVQASGTILTSKIEKKYVSGAGVTTGEWEFIPVIEYEYQYDGRSFRSSMRRPSNYSVGQIPEAEAIVARYPVGSGVCVFVNSKRPDVAVLEYGTTPLSWICIIVGLIVTSMGVLFITAR